MDEAVDEALSNVWYADDEDDLVEEITGSNCKRLWSGPEMKNLHLQHPEDSILTGDLSVLDWFKEESRCFGKD